MAYYERMEIMNTILPDEVQEPINSSQLSYASNKGKDNRGEQVSKVTDNSIQKNTPHVSNKVSALKSIPTTCGEHAVNKTTNSRPLQKVFNIQLPYNINQALEENLWDGNFHSISLHSALEHLPLDSKNIKESLKNISRTKVLKLVR